MKWKTLFSKENSLVSLCAILATLNFAIGFYFAHTTNFEEIPLVIKTGVSSDINYVKGYIFTLAAMLFYFRNKITSLEAKIEQLGKDRR